MTALDPALCARLVGEAREDDELMTDAPWHGDSNVGVLFGDGLHADGAIELAHMDGEAKEFDPVAIARTRNNLRDLADQLEAALAEVARMRPVIDAAVRVAELDEICEAHPRIDDEAGNQAERDLPAAVLARKDAIDACRKAKP